ncbi:acetyl-CoA carboxylase biotin carboxyl carrier protein subunit [Flavobacterium sp.]|uniref:acetyl-CoA carboxylase biotin carboxyl carrier protein subunit n=1 Tax=Flavobacterium sp. TaxID=239 RepID=UPI0037AE7FBE
MSIGYKVNVNDTFHFDLEEESISKLDAVKTDLNKFHVLHQNTPYKAEIVSSDFNQKNYTVNVNNNIYTVSIANALDLLIKEMGIEAGLTKQVNAIKAPMPGLIIEISVVVGQTVKENDNLIILSAMKMENSFLSPRDGVIKTISVAAGDVVDKGQLLIEFE